VRKLRKLLKRPIKLVFGKSLSFSTSLRSFFKQLGGVGAHVSATCCSLAAQGKLNFGLDLDNDRHLGLLLLSLIAAPLASKRPGRAIGSLQDGS
jgi:hypothetical protein